MKTMRINTEKFQGVKPIIHIYEPTKVNKNSTIYSLSETLGIRTSNPDDHFTKLVKIEKYQGYSNAYNVSHYFKIRDKTNWSKCKTPTGLFKTTNTRLFKGDIRETNGSRTLILFSLEDNGILQIFKYPKGYYPRGRELVYLLNQFN